MDCPNWATFFLVVFSYPPCAEPVILLPVLSGLWLNITGLQYETITSMFYIEPFACLPFYVAQYIQILYLLLHPQINIYIVLYYVYTWWMWVVEMQSIVNYLFTVKSFFRNPLLRRTHSDKWTFFFWVLSCDPFASWHVSVPVRRRHLLCWYTCSDFDVLPSQKFYCIYVYLILWSFYGCLVLCDVVDKCVCLDFQIAWIFWCLWDNVK